MDMTIITGAYNGLKTVKDVFTGLSDLKIETETLAKINESVKSVGEAQDALFQLREELFRLQSDNDALRKKLSNVESWDNKISNYSLIKTNAGAVVYKSNGDPLHYACPNCAAKQELQFLQELGGYSGSSECPSCKTMYPIEPDKPMPDIDYGSNSYI
jgi:regulator of replication initiation timing